jgi:hypothetical protein
VKLLPSDRKELLRPKTIMNRIRKSALLVADGRSFVASLPRTAEPQLQSKIRAFSSTFAVRQFRQQTSRPLPHTSQIRHASGSRAKPKLPRASTELIGPYGLRRVDYSKPPRNWPLPPPPPESKRASERYFPFVVAAVALGVGVWIYFNQDENVYDYWKQVEQGNVPLNHPYDDDDDDDDEEDEDEWEDRK